MPKDVLAELAGWQPIETAPRDGTEILLFGSVAPGTKPRVFSGKWSPYGNWWSLWVWGVAPEGVTHWQAMPEPPVT